MKINTLLNHLTNSKFWILSLLCILLIPSFSLGQITGASSNLTNSTITNGSPIAVTGCAGVNAASSDHPFTITFTTTDPDIGPAGYDWSVGSTFIAHFPDFLTDAAPAMITAPPPTWTTNTGAVPSVDITFSPRDTNVGMFSFSLTAETFTINVTINISGGSGACGGGPGPTMDLNVTPIWAGQNHLQSTNFNTFTFTATGSAGDYVWEVLDNADAPMSLGQTFGLGFNPGPVTSITESSGIITIGGNSPSGPSGGPYSVKIKVSDATDGGNFKVLGPISYDIGPVNPRGNVLLVKACPDGIPCDPTDIVTFPDPGPKLTSVKNWVDEVSYTPDLLTFSEYAYPNPNQAISLNQALNNYITNNDPLGSIGTEVVNSIVTATPGLIEGSPNIEHIIIYTHDDQNVLDYWATTGKISITTGEGVKTLGISIVDANSDWRTIAHAIGHNLTLMDLHYYQNATFLGSAGPPSPNLSPVGWDHMAIADDGTMSGVHPVSFSKNLTGWLNTPSTNGIRYLTGNPIPSTITTVAFQSERPGVGSTFSEINTVAVGLTPGAGVLPNEEHFFIIETRSSSLGNLDGTVPTDGALVYYVNRLIPQGAAPVLLYDHNSGGSLNDAAIPFGSSASDINGSGLDVQVGPLVGGTADITIEYNPPPTYYDAKIPKGNPTYTSPDIWVWNQQEGGSRADNYRTPVVGETNRIYARVYNDGPATAYDLKIEFHFSAPFNSVEGFTFFDDVTIPEIPSGGFEDVYVPWTPPQNTLGHNCVRVFVRDAFNDNNLANNDAQQNLTVVDTWPNSPFPPRVFKFKIKNPDNISRYIYPELDGIPASWTYSFSPEGTTFNPNQEKEFTLTYQPPADYDVCTNHAVNIVAWTPHEHTLLRIGGVAVNIQVREDTKLTLDQNLGNCKIDRNPNRGHGLPSAEPCACNETTADVNYTAYEYGQLINYQLANYVQATDLPFQRQCKTLNSSGCTSPVRANQKIVLRYRDPTGNPIYKEVMTDANGCYQDFFVVVEGGDWETTAIYPGTDCNREVETTVNTNIDIPFNGDQDYDGLPDKEEIQGDHNGNGIPNHLDPDSDSDGIIDGKEIKGNCDNDSYENVVDSDSDNDGILDGQDKNPCEPDKTDQDNGDGDDDDDDDEGKGGITLPFGFGITTPLKAFDDTYDSGLLIELKALFPLTTFNPNNTGNLSLSLNLEAGIYTFEDSRNTDQPLNIWGIAAGPRLDYYPSRKENLSGFTVYADLNGGGYNPSNNPFESDLTFGWNYGVGVGYKYNRFAIDLGYSRFYVGDSIDFSGLGLAIGVSF